MMNEYRSFKLKKKKKKKKLFLTYLVPECKEHANFRTSIQMSYTMVLYIESTLDQYGLDLSNMGPLLC